MGSRRVDDRDPSLVYSENSGQPQSDWFLLPNIPGAFDGTLSATRISNATVTFSFVGTGVSVYGATEGPGLALPWGTSHYIVDNDISTQSSLTPSSGGSVQQIQFYQSPPLTNGPHKLVITNVIENRPLAIDFISVTSSIAPESALLTGPLRTSTIPPPTSFITPRTTSILSFSTAKLTTISATAYAGVYTTATGIETSVPPYLATDTHGSASPATAKPGPPSPASATHGGIPISGVVVGGATIGIFVLLAIAGDLARLWRRRRASQISGNGPASSTTVGRPLSHTTRASTAEPEVASFPPATTVTPRISSTTWRPRSEVDALQTDGESLHADTAGIPESSKHALEVEDERAMRMSRGAMERVSIFSDLSYMSDPPPSYKTS